MQAVVSCKLISIYFICQTHPINGSCLDMGSPSKFIYRKEKELYRKKNRECTVGRRIRPTKKGNRTQQSSQISLPIHFDIKIDRIKQIKYMLHNLRKKHNRVKQS